MAMACQEEEDAHLGAEQRLVHAHPGAVVPAHAPIARERDAQATGVAMTVDRGNRVEREGEEAREEDVVVVLAAWKCGSASRFLLHQPIG